MPSEQFFTALKAIGQRAESEISKTDYYHMRIIGLAGHGSFLLGVYCAVQQYMLPAAVLMAWSLMISWLLMHHIGHGGYNKIAGIPRRYHSKHYAQGWRRYIDWFDWIKPEAWNYEHNYLHHSFTGELKDPDLVEENLDWLAKAKLPVPLKKLILLFFALTWKVTYYSARTLSFLRGHNKVTFANFLDIRQKSQRVMWLQLFLPYGLFHFALLPLLVEWWFSAGGSFLLCRIVAELLHNLHTFIIIVPNHAGEDLCRFHDIQKQQRRGDSYYLRQILGSANYHCGNEWLDLSQMYLNYQIEHHLFPALPMRQYRRIQPQVKALCLQHGVPYIQESVWQRLSKMVAIATGCQKMQTTVPVNISQR
ncbi:fatty acid desaturase family protein [Planctobacterium marinum]|uniref:fatty acid desaturase family protein n=1 Tax=Planctobacterium marinum TaxID=1631968 RepID=UPI001E511F35|nr:fatty acid desaturase [Planctobacterium marinum]MCC2606373.1 fatty acid desaturase [Planctobacterium marinum]